MLDKKCIGAIACRLQRVEGNKDTALLYVLTLGVVAPFRKQGIGVHLPAYLLFPAQREVTHSTTQHNLPHGM